jgi:ribonuclease D
MPPAYEWIDTPSGFQSILKELQKAPRIAVDIEADSLYHYYEKICLLQVSTDNKTFIIDPLALPGLRELAPIMADGLVEKVFHAAAYDTYCLRRDYGFSFRNLFDTHQAALLLGYEKIGLSALLERFLGITHPKHPQRDDWSRRPLHPRQLDYAARDTHHLLELRDLLERLLREKNRLHWAREEFEAASISIPEQRQFDPEGFRRIKGSRHLSPQQLCLLRALYQLRDKIARKMDLPPFKVLNDSVLLVLAQRNPESMQALSLVRGVSERVFRQFGRDIIRALDAARRDDPATLIPPYVSTWTPPSRETRLRVERLKTWRAAKAQTLELPVGVLFPGALLENVAASAPATLEALQSLPGMRHWRMELLGSEILDLISQSTAETNP